MSRLRVVVLVALALWPASAWAQISATFLQMTEDGTGQTGYTFAAQNLGTAAADRYITVVSLARKTGAANCTAPTVTIGGVSATVVTSLGSNGSGANCNVAAIHKALVPTGTTGSIVLVYPDGMLRAHIAVYRSTGAQLVAGSSTGSSTASDPTGTLTIAANGYGVGGSLSTCVACGLTATWTGLTEQFDAAMTGSTANFATGAFLAPSTLQSGITVTADWSNVGTDVTGVWAAWAPLAVASSPTHYVTSGGSGSSSCTVGSPCTITRAFALAGSATIPPGSYVSVAAGIYAQAQLAPTSGGVDGYPIRFVGAGTSYTTGSRLTGTRTSFPGASWSLCAGQTYTYCATFDEATNYTVGMVAQRPGPLMTTWVDIIVDDRSPTSGWAPSGRLFTLDEPVRYNEEFSTANVELQHCTFFHDTTNNLLKIHPCREAAPTDGDQYYAGPDDWGSITFAGSADYLSLENLSFEQTSGYAVIIDESSRGIVMDDLRFLSTGLNSNGINTVGTDLVMKQAYRQGPPYSGCYSSQYGGIGLASRSCWNDSGDGYALQVGEEDTVFVYNQSFDRVTISQGWNGLKVNGPNTVNHLTAWGFCNHAATFNGTGVTIRNSIFLNSGDGPLVVDNDWETHTYENNLLYNNTWFNCGRDGTQGSVTCPTTWTFRNNIVATMISDWMVEGTVNRDCNIWMTRSNGQALLREEQGEGEPTDDYFSVTEIQAGTISDDNSIQRPYTSWYDGSIFANWNTQEDPLSAIYTLTSGGAALLTTCGAVAGPDTLTSGDVVPPTAARFRWRVP